jgi:DNA polymerase sigma
MKLNSKKSIQNYIRTLTSTSRNKRKEIRKYMKNKSEKLIKRKERRARLKMKISVRMKKNKNFRLQAKNKFRRIKKKHPWITKQSLNSQGLLKLHYEIFEFYEYIKPGETETNRMTETYFLFKEMIEKKWPTWNVKLFGSFPIDLHLKDSDIDLVVFKSESLNFSTDNMTLYDSIGEYEQLLVIFYHLYDSRKWKDIKLIDARVPIIRVIAENNVKVDIS